MFTNFTIGILVALGFGAWVYKKIYRSTGGNNSNALIVAGIAAAAALLLVVTLLSFVPGS